MQYLCSLSALSYINNSGQNNQQINHTPKYYSILNSEYAIRSSLSSIDDYAVSPPVYRNNTPSEPRANPAFSPKNLTL